MAEPQTLQRRLLGDSFDRLPAALRYQLGGEGALVASGACSVTHGGSLVARLMCWLLRLPRKGSDQPFTLRTEKKGRMMLVAREIGDRRLVFRARIGRGRRANRLKQSRGAWTFVSTVASAEGGVVYRHRGARLVGLPLPGFLAPRFTAHEWPDGEDGVAFDATFSLPGGRRLIRLHGWFRAEKYLAGADAVGNVEAPGSR